MQDQIEERQADKVLIPKESMLGSGANLGKLGSIPHSLTTVGSRVARAPFNLLRRTSGSEDAEGLPQTASSSMQTCLLCRADRQVDVGVLEPG